MARTSSKVKTAPKMDLEAIIAAAVATAVAEATKGQAKAAPKAEDNRPATGGQLWSLNRYAPAMLAELVAKGTATYAVCSDTVAMLKDDGTIPPSKRDRTGSR